MTPEQKKLVNELADIAHDSVNLLNRLRSVMARKRINAIMAELKDLENDT